MAIVTSVLTAWQSSKTISETTIENGLQITNNFAEQTVLALLTGSVENGQEAIARALGFKSILAVSMFNDLGEVLLSSEKIPFDKFKPDIKNSVNIAN